MKIDIETHEVILHPFPHRDVGAYQSVVDLEGIIWTVFTNADAVGRFDPETEEWTWYDLPTVGTESHGHRGEGMTRRCWSLCCCSANGCLVPRRACWRDGVSQVAESVEE